MRTRDARVAAAPRDEGDVMRARELRAAVIAGSRWVPHAPSATLAPVVEVLATPGANDTHTSLRSPARTYVGAVDHLLASYRLLREGEAPGERLRREVAAERSSPISLPDALRKLDVPPGARVVPLEYGEGACELVSAGPSAPPVATHPASAADRIAVDPEDLGVRVYIFRGRLCAIAASVGRALGYADDGKKLADRVRDEWSSDLIPGHDFDVLEGDALREFKALSALTPDGGVSPNTRSLMVLFETGWDLVCIKTDKPEGHRLRRRLAEEVLPKLRRGHSVGPTGQAAPVLNEERVGAIVAGALATAMPKIIEGTVQALRPLFPQLASAPAQTPAPGSAPTVSPSNEIHRSWISAQTIAAILSERQGRRVTEAKVNTAIRALDIRESAERAAYRLVPQLSSGVAYSVPSWRYAPEVTEMVARRLFPTGPVQTPLPGDVGFESSAAKPGATRPN